MNEDEVTHLDLIPHAQRVEFVSSVLAARIEAEASRLLKDWDALALACEAEITGSSVDEIVRTYEPAALRHLRDLVEQALLARLPSWQ